MKDKQPLFKHEKKLRAKVYYFVWQEFKTESSMESLAKILKTSTSNLYQVIKRKEKNV